MKNAAASNANEYAPIGDIDLFDVLMGVWARRFSIFLCTFIGIGLAVAYLVVTPSKYEAELRIFVDRTESEFTRPLEQAQDGGTQQLFDKEAVESQVQILLTNDLALEVGRRLNLANEPEFASGGGILSAILGSTPQDDEQSFLDAYYERLVVYPVGESRIIAIKFKSESPDLAAKVANTLSDVYFETQSKAKSETAQRAGGWLEDQINVLRGRVAEAETRVQSFRAKNGLFDGRENQSLDSQRLGELTTELIKSKALRSEAQARAEMIRAMVRKGENLETIGDIAGSQLIQRLIEQRVTLMSQMSELSSTLGPKHPRILELKAELDSLSSQIKSEGAKIAQSLENEARLAGAREQALTQSMDAQKVVSSLSEEQQIELDALEREAETQRELLKVYLTRYSEAVARQVPEVTPANARVVSKARPPLDPTSPKKAGTLVIGAFTGFLVGFLIAMTRATFDGQKRAVAKDPYMVSSQRNGEGPNTPPSGGYSAPEPNFNVGGMMPQFSPQPVHSHMQQAASQFTPQPVQGFAPQPSPQFAPQFSPTGQPIALGGVAALAAQLQNSHNLYGFVRLLCVYPGQQSIMPRQVARGLARGGKSVLLVETNASNGMQGLSEALEGQVPLANVLIKDKLSNAHIIAGGTFGLSPQRLDRFEAALKALQASYDFVLVSAPQTGVSAPLLSLSPDVCLMGLPASEPARYAPYAERVMVFGSGEANNNHGFAA